MTIYEELYEIQSKLVLTKDIDNEFGNFKYFTIADIFKAFKELNIVKERKLVLTFKDDIIEIGGRFYIDETVTLTNADGESIQHFIKIREPQNSKPKMDESQTSGSAITYARKYALIGLFAIGAEEKGIDPDSYEPETERKTIIKPKIDVKKQIDF